MQSLRDTLEIEFCPPLDTSLLAALIADLEPSTPPDQLNALRTTLKELANQATRQHEHELARELDLFSLCPATDDSNSIPDFCGEMTETSATSDSSIFSCQSFSSPLGFLCAALPHIPQSRLRRALSEAGAGDDGDVDMESVVESILTSEFILDLQERGLDALSDDPRPSPYSPLDDDLWTFVEPKKKPTTSGKATKKKKPGAKTLTIVDVRQKQHLVPPTPSGPPAPDPWTQLCSLSEHLATLLPPHPASFFQSHFHSPKYASPAKALRAALSSVVGTQNSSPFEASARATLFNMLDILRDSPAYVSLDPEQRSVLYADVQLALRATHGRGDDAIDIVWLLVELELDLQSGTLAMGVYHSPQSLSPSPSSPWISTSTVSAPPSASRNRSSSTNATTYQLPSGPPPIQSSPTSKRKSVSSPSGSRASNQALQWQTVPQKTPKGPHPLALHIPAYDPANQSRRSAGMGKVRGNGKGDVGDVTRPDLKQRMTASLKKRDEMLREASKAWSRGNAKTRGGEVALYFAERAREFQEVARREALNRARIMVESKRARPADRRTVDLHGTSIAEAVVIVKEILEEEGSSAADPLRIITGRGTHSANGVGVLKPAVRNALVRDGWNVGVWDGGLVVRGRT